MARRLSWYVYVCVCVLMMGLASPAFGQYVVNLNVPLYAQEYGNWSGPASAQMIMNGYPDPGHCVYYLQGLIWYIIQGNNLPDEPYEWDTDPYGLQQTLLELNPPPAGTWSLMTNTDREDLMFQVLYWMNVQEYPTPTLVYEGARWVVIKGYETDIEPVYGSDPVLQTITINDPFPTGQGATSTMAGTVWYANYWNGAITAPGTWFGKYVAIISSEQALAYARYWIQQLNLGAKDSSYSSLADTGLIPFDPILVNEDIKPTVVKSVNESVCYYLLRYAKGDEFKKGLTRVCVIVNAFTGAFEEVTSFGTPITYLEERKAIEMAAQALKITTLESNAKETKAAVVFTPCDFSYLRAYPFWKVEINGKVVYVEMNGKVHFTLPAVPASYGK
jgi:hypothetical protein